MNVYNKLTKNQTGLFEVLKTEIDLKSNCTPFAIKVLDAFTKINPQNHQKEIDVVNAFLSGMQTLVSAGFTAEDYDVMDFVPRGGLIVPSGRVEGFYRACARKGYRFSDDIIAVPKEDESTTYFREEFYQGNIFYVLEDKRINTDRSITADRLLKNYFSKFICRMTITEIATNNQIVSKVTEMSTDEILKIASVSYQGLNKNGSMWQKWTSEMVAKSIIRRALKRVKDVLPQALQSSIYAFDTQENVVATQEVQTPEQKPLIPIEQPKVELDNLTDEQRQDCNEMFDIFKSNPKQASIELENIQNLIDYGTPKQEIINSYYAVLMCLSKMNSKWKEFYPLVGDLYV